VLLIADMCPYSLEIIISSSFLLHFGQADNKNLKISRGQLAPCQENRIKRQQTVISQDARFWYRRRAFYWLRCLLTVVSNQYSAIIQSQSLSLSPRTKFGDQQ